jgi:hypothetical protein
LKRARKLKDAFFGNLTIWNVPNSLLREFMRTVVWPKYPGGISEAPARAKKLDIFQP